jgi:hypothetical protein
MPSRESERGKANGLAFEGQPFIKSFILFLVRKAGVEPASLSALAPLACLGGLRTLILNNNTRVTDLAVLAIPLQSLYVSRTKVSDLVPLPTSPRCNRSMYRKRGSGPRLPLPTSAACKH